MTLPQLTTCAVCENEYVYCECPPKEGEGIMTEKYILLPLVIIHEDSGHPDEPDNYYIENAEGNQIGAFYNRDTVEQVVRAISAYEPMREALEFGLHLDGDLNYEDRAYVLAEFIKAARAALATVDKVG